MDLLHLYLLIFSYIIHFGFGDDTTEFNTQPKRERYFVNSNDANVSLPCSVGETYAKEPYMLSWIKIVNNSPRIITFGSTNRMTDLYDLDTTSCGGCYNLRIHKITYEHDNARFFCQIIGPNNYVVESNPGDVIVLVKPGEAKITVQPSAPVREGSVVNFECRSVGGNPPPKIRWFFNNGTEILGQVVKQTNATDATSATVGNLQSIVTAAENGAKVMCRVWNEALKEGDQRLEAMSTPLSVLYAPRVSVGPASPYNVELGSVATLYCSADGNPVPSRFSWFLNGNPQPTGNGGQNLTFIVTKTHTGRYTCMAASEDNSTGTESMELNVLYGPEIGLNAEYRGVVGRSVNLLCNVDANPPPSSIGWTGPNGHSSDTKILEIESVTLKDLGNYTCTAKNSLNLYSVGVVSRQSTKTTTLMIDHAPGKGVISTPEASVVGSTVNLTCKADDVGSPPADYKWKLPGQNEFESGSRQVLTITDVKMSQAGEYACLPYNSIGNGEVGTFNLIVYEPARMEQLLETNNSKNEGDPTFSFSCSAKGFPAPNITWFKDEEPITDSDHWSIGRRAEPNECQIPAQCLLKVYGSLEWKSPVKWSDKGVYTCQAFNGAGSPAKSNATLKVSHKPVVINDPNRPFVASDVGQSASIECKVNARPEPTFRWYKDGQEITTNGAGADISASSPSPSSSSSYSFSSQHTSETDDVYENTLTLNKVQEHDMGEYMCKATNALGEHKFVFTLQLKTKPMMPSNLHVVSHSYRSIYVGWTPGFDGGDAQIFSVEVVYPDNTQRYYNISEMSKYARFKRFIGIEKATPTMINISELVMPSTEYKIRVKSSNRLGETEWTTPITTWTDDAPLDTSIPKPTSGVYNTDTQVLDFKPTTLDLQAYCILVYRQQSSGKYAAQQCYSPSGRIEKLKPANNFKIRFCLSPSYVCGEEYEVMTGAQSPITWEIIVAIVASAVFLLVVAIIIFVYCYRTRRSLKKANNNNNLSSSSTMGRSTANGQRKDYEMETNQVRQNLYQTDKIVNGTATTLDRQPAVSSSKDSGIFTTESSFQYDPRTGGSSGVGDNNSTMMIVGVGGSGGLNRTPSYDDQEHWGATDGYGLRNSYLNTGGADGGSLSKNDSLTSPYYDSYAVDMNPAGGGAINVDASSLHSGYSTPNGRRVMREIIV